MVSNRCPSETSIRAFFVSDGEEGKLDQVIAHVRRCPACEKLVESLQEELGDRLRSVTIVCPSETRIRAFVMGQVNEGDQDAIRTHVMSCPACDRLIQSLQRQIDTRLEVLKKQLPSIPLPDRRSTNKSNRDFKIVPQNSSAQDSAKRGPRKVDASQAIPDVLKSPSLKRQAKDRAQENSLRSFGDYELLQEVGCGDTGSVYRAFHVGVEQHVAVKMIDSGILLNELAFDFFQDETRFLSRLDHPRIVSVYEADEIEGQRFYSMRFVEGRRNLSELLPHFRSNFRAAVGFLIEVADAVHYAHKSGILHRDIRPENILLDSEGNPVIKNFGLASCVQPQQLVENPWVLGNPGFKSPEDLEDHVDSVTPASDVYGLGALLYYCLTGRAPFEGENVELLHDAVKYEAPAAPSSLFSSIPRNLDFICLKCLAKDPASRYASARHLADELRRYQAGLPINRRHRKLDLSYVAAPLLVSSLLGLFVLRGGGAHAVGADRVVRLVDGNPADTKSAERVSTGPEIPKSSIHSGLLNVGRLLEPELLGSTAVFSTALSGISQPLTKKIEFDEVERFKLLGLESVGGENPSLVTSKSERGPSNLGSSLDSDAESAVVGLTQDDPISLVAYSPDGLRVITATWQGVLKLRDAKTGQAILTFKSVADEVRSIAFSSDGSRIVTAGGDGTAKIWDAKNGRVLKSLKGSQRLLNSVCFSPDGKLILTGSEDTKVKLWNIDKVKDIQTFKHNHQVSSVCFSPDGTKILSASKDGTAKIWDLESGKEILIISAKSGGVLSACFSPDTTRVLTVGLDGLAKVWDSSNGEKLLSLSGHDSDIKSACFSPDGSLVATGSLDRKIILWNAQNGSKVRTLTGHNGSVLSVSFSPDGSQLISGGYQGIARVYEVSTGTEILAFKGVDDGVLTSSEKTGSTDNSKGVISAVAGTSDATLASQTTSVFISNAGFEAQIVPASNTFGVPGWTGSCVSDVYGVVPSLNDSLPVPEGEHVAFVSNFQNLTGQVTSYGLSQQLTETLRPNTTYQVSADFGSGEDEDESTGILELWVGGVTSNGDVVGGTLLAWAQVPLIKGQFASGSLVYTPGGDTSHSGEVFSIRLTTKPSSASSYVRTYVDRITMTSASSGKVVPLAQAQP